MSDFAGSASSAATAATGATGASPGTVPLQASLARPTRTIQIWNFVLFQAAWFAAILGAANGLAVWGSVFTAAVIGWHIAVSARPATEAKLVGCVLAIGCIVEGFSLWQGHVVFASGQPDPHLPPHWMIALWGLLAIALNVTMRWMKGRWWLAAALGAVAGPLSYASGVRLGAAQFVDRTPALISLAVIWALTMPVLMWLSDRFDGVAVLERRGRHG